MVCVRYSYFWMHSALVWVEHGMCPVLVHSDLQGQTWYVSSIGAQSACEVKHGMCLVLVHSELLRSNMVCVQYWTLVHSGIVRSNMECVQYNDTVNKAISKMKSGKAAGPSGIVVEMIKAAGDTGATMIGHLATAIIRDGKVPTDWEQSFIACLYKGNGDALDRGNYRGLKLTEQAMKILERIVDGLIRQVVSIDDSQFGFVPGRGTTDAIFVVRQLQEKYLAVNKRLYMAFVDLEKAFDLVPQKVICWVLRKLGVEEWIVRLVQGMYANARSRVCVGEGFSKEFEVKVGVHQGSVLSPLLFIIVLEALSREFRAGVLWEDLYADDLVIIADSLEECVRRLLIWKEVMEKKGLRVNAGKTKVMICGTGLDLLQSSGEYP